MTPSVGMATDASSTYKPRPAVSRLAIAQDVPVRGGTRVIGIVYLKEHIEKREAILESHVNRLAGQGPVQDPDWESAIVSPEPSYGLFLYVIILAKL